MAGLKKPIGDPRTLLLKCNYDVRDLNLSLNGFNQQLLEWWADFRNAFSDIYYAIM